MLQEFTVTGKLTPLYQIENAVRGFLAKEQANEYNHETGYAPEIFEKVELRLPFADMMPHMGVTGFDMVRLR